MSFDTPYRTTTQQPFYFLCFKIMSKDTTSLSQWVLEDSSFP